MTEAQRTHCRGLAFERVEKMMDRIQQENHKYLSLLENQTGYCSYWIAGHDQCWARRGVWMLLRKFVDIRVRICETSICITQTRHNHWLWILFVWYISAYRISSFHCIRFYLEHTQTWGKTFLSSFKQIFRAVWCRSFSRIFGRLSSGAGCWGSAIWHPGGSNSSRVSGGLLSQKALRIPDPHEIAD